MPTADILLVLLAGLLAVLIGRHLVVLVRSNLAVFRIEAGNEKKGGDL